jgi:hypothetical protein
VSPPKLIVISPARRLMVIPAAQAVPLLKCR